MGTVVQFPGGNQPQCSVPACPLAPLIAAHGARLDSAEEKSNDIEARAVRLESKFDKLVMLMLATLLTAAVSLVGQLVVLVLKK